MPHVASDTVATMANSWLKFCWRAEHISTFHHQISTEYFKEAHLLARLQYRLTSLSSRFWKSAITQPPLESQASMEEPTPISLLFMWKKIIRGK